MSAPTVTAELKALLRKVKLGRCVDTLPERLALAATGLGHAEFLELVLADEVTRRETSSAELRAHAAGLDPAMTVDRWDDTAKITYDHATWNELSSLRFVESGHNAVIMGPVGDGNTFVATALDTADVYELIVERHRAAATVVTSNREPIEWLAQMADPLLAQSAIDRLQSATHELVLDDESYRQRQRPSITTSNTLDQPTAAPRSSRRRR